MFVIIKIIFIFALSMFSTNAKNQQSPLNISSESLRFFPSLDRNIDTQISSCVMNMEHYKNFSIDDVDGEIWKPLHINSEIYRISNLGRIKTINHKAHGIVAILKQSITKHGFLRISLWVNNKSVGYAVHDLVASAFVPNKNNVLASFHKNEIRQDNRADNLLWEIPSLENEEWKNIIGWEGDYQISNYGRVKRLSRYRKTLNNCIAVAGEYILKTPPNKNGYLKVSLKRDMKNSNYTVHRLVAMAFIPNTENKPAVNHKNGIKSDNSVFNLEWCTYKENTHHGMRIGLIDIRGEKATSHKLTPKQVLEIFNSPLSVKELKSIYPVKDHAIRDIKSGESWNLVTKIPSKNQNNYPS